MDATVIMPIDETIVDQAACFHCGLPVPKHTNFQLTIDGDIKPMCCLGCLAVADYIHHTGMGDFYHFRGHQLPKIAANKRFSKHHAWAAYDLPEALQKFAGSPPAETCYTRIYVAGMYCTSCAWLIDAALNTLPGVTEVQLNSSHHLVSFMWHPEQIKLSKILATLAKLGYTPRPLAVTEMGTEHAHQEHNHALKRLAVAGFGMMQVMTYAVALYLGDMQGMDDVMRQFLMLISLLVSTAVVCYAGQPFFKHAYYALKHHHLGMDVPVALAIGGAYLASVWQVLWLDGDYATIADHVYFDSAVMFVFFLSLGRFLEMRARHATLSSADALQQLLPPLVTVIRGQTEQVVTPQQIILGDQIHVKCGETVPCEGTILFGQGHLDESILTGESRIECRSDGDPVIAGTRLVRGDITLVADRQWQDSTMAAIQRLLDRPQGMASPQQVFNDALSHYFVAAVLVITLLVAGFWYVYSPTDVFGVVLAMLIASCPCAFALAMPAVNTVASCVLSRHGALLNNYQVLKKITQVEHWCFDKTGTLSTGVKALDDGEALSAIETNPSLLASGQGGKQPAMAASIEEPRHDGKDLLGYLSSLGKQISMLSGDRQAAVARFARQLPLDHYYSDMTAEDKLQHVQLLQAQQTVAMVGDGVNDAPVLNVADVSVAMASGSQLSQSHADIVLLGGRLGALQTVFKVARQAQRITQQNVFWAIAYNLCVLPLAAAGMLEPWIAAIGMSLSSLLVVLNARRLSWLKL